jgi:hypothetical protein
MKKSEKIEVRLSHEEKLALAQMAEDEGRSVSELIRGLIDRYMSLHKDRLPQKPKWGRLALMGLGGLLIGHLGTYFMVQSHSHLEVYQLGAFIQNTSINVAITRTEGEETTFIVPNPKGDITISAKVRKGDGILSVVEVSLCQMKDTTCELIASPELTFNSEQASMIRFQHDEDEISLHLSPPRRDRKT